MGSTSEPEPELIACGNWVGQQVSMGGLELVFMYFVVITALFRHYVFLFP